MRGCYNFLFIYLTFLHFICIFIQVIREATFIGEGYLELAGQTLSRKSSLSLVFATLQPEALLLLSQPVYLEVS
jgi:hypothetical protein